MWQLPECNGRKVPILKIIEIRSIYYGNNKPNLSNLELDDFENYSMEYFENFNLLVRSLLTKNYTKTIEYISECEELVPNEANLIFLRHLYNKGLGNNELSNKNLESLAKTKLKYLLK